MSRPINISSATTQMLLVSSATTGSYNFTTSTNANSAVTNAYTNANSTTYARLQLSANRYSARTSTVYFEFDKTPLSEIPSNATISSVSARVKYYVSSTSYVTAVSIQLHNNTSAKGSATTARTTTATVYTMTAGTWTATELQNIRLYVSATHSASNSSAYLYLYGVDVTVNYALNGTEYEVSFNNQSYDATTDPSTTQYIFQGGSQLVRIYVDDIDDIVVKDNNNDVSASIVEVPPSNNTASVNAVAGASYGFTLDASDGYYKSQNSGQDSSLAVCRLNVTAATNCTLTIRYVNYAEATYDYGIIGKLDTTLAYNTTATTESANWLWAGSAQTDNSSTEQSIDIPITSGNHFVDIKFRKDTYTGENNDAFWFKYELNPAVSPKHYTYTIQNISADHTISIDDAAIGNTYDVNASSTYAGATITPSTQSIREGRNATVHISVANLYEIVVKDNGTTVTNSLVQNSTGYTYTISNVQAIHNVTVEEATYYTVSTASTYAGATATANPSKVYAGRDSYVEVDVANLYEIVVKDNGSVISLSNPISTNGNYIPTAYDSEYSTHGGEYGASYGVNNGLTDSASTTYARIYLNTGAQAESRLSYFFDCSQIPQNAKITSVSCVVRAYCNGSTTQVPTRQVQLYNGTTAKGTAGTLGISNGTVNVAGGTWTREELEDIKIVARCVRGNSNVTNNYYIYFYGATLTVQYEVPATYTLTNVQTDHAITIEEAPYYTISTASTYANASASVSPTKLYRGIDANITVSVQNLYEINIKLDGTDVTSNFTGSNGTYTYTLQNVTTNHALTIEEAPYYTITVNNSYQDATITVDPPKGYYGIDVDIRIEVDDIDEIKVEDNNVNVMANIIKVSDGLYRYTLNAIAANHTITVVESTKYTINASSTYTAVTIQPTTVNVIEGHSQTFVIEGDEDTDLEADIMVTDNNVDVTNQLVLVTGGTEDSLSYVLGAFDETNSQYVGIYNNYEPSHPVGVSGEDGAVTSSSGSTRASFYPATGTGSELLVYYDFNVSGIPEGVIITNVSCDVAAAPAYSGNGYSEMDLQLCVGTTPKGNSTPISSASTNANIHAVDGGSGWTLSDLANVKIRMHGIRNNTNSNNDDTGKRDNLNICGASLIVTYSYPGGCSYTITNVQTAHTIVVSEVPVTYYAINASSTYQDATITPATQSIRQNHVARVQISAESIYDIVVTDNGVNVTGELVENETGFTYTTPKVTVAHTIIVSESESFTVTTSSQYAGATITPATQTLRQGMNATTYIEVGNVDEISVTDNGVEVGDQLVLTTPGETYTLSGILTTFDSVNSQYVGTYSSYASTNAENNSSADAMAATGSTRSAFYPHSGVGSELLIYYNFEQVTGVPSNAVITNVSANVVMSTAYSGQGYSDVYVQLCIGTTPVGEATHPVIGPSGSTPSGQAAAQNLSVDGGSGWTISDLANAKVLMYGVRNSTNSDSSNPETRDNLSMHGGDIIVTYTDGESFNGYTYTIHNLQTGHTVVITENPQYSLTASSQVQGVTITPASATVYGRQSVVFNISGDMTDLVIMDNNVDVTTRLRHSSTGYTYTVENVTTGHTIIIMEEPQESDYVKIAGEFKKIKGFYKRINGVWTLIEKSAFDTQVSTGIAFYGGVIENTTIGEVESSGGIISITINDGSLDSGTYRMVYEDASRTPLARYTDIEQFTIQ